MKAVALGSLILSLTVTFAAQSATLHFDAPKEWTAQPSSSAMRVAQYTLPRAAGDSEDGELIVYYFGGQGGSVQANLDRWVGQMEQPDGRPSKAVANTETMTVNAMKVTVLDVSGTYVAEMAPGSANRHNKPNFRMKAAVVETPAGPYFVKLTGPAKTVERWNAAYTAFLKSAKVRG
jgi:hypothetical protein